MILTLDIYILFVGLLFVYGPSGGGKTTFIKDFLYECENHFDTSVDRIVYIYSIWHELLDRLRDSRPEIEFVENIFPDSQFFSKDQNNLVIYDDLIVELASSSYLTRLCTKNYTKYNLFCIVISQLLFHPGEPFKSLTSNATNIILFKHRRSKQQINIFIRQIGSTRLTSGGFHYQSLYSSVCDDYYSITKEYRGQGDNGTMDSGGCCCTFNSTFFRLSLQIKTLIMESLVVYHKITSSGPFTYLVIDLHPQSKSLDKVFTNMLFSDDRSMVVFDCE